MTISVKNDLLLQPSPLVQNAKTRRVRSVAPLARRTKTLASANVATSENSSASKTQGFVAQALTRAWRAVSARFASWRESVAELFVIHSVGLGIYKKYRTYVPSKEDFDTIFDKKATEQEKVKALDNKMLKLGIVVSVMKHEPLASQDYDILNLRRILFTRMVGPLNMPKNEAQRSLRKMYLMAHPDRVRNMSQVMRLELFAGELYKAVQHLQSLCDDDMSFATLTNRK